MTQENENKPQTQAPEEIAAETGAEAAGEPREGEAGAGTEGLGTEGAGAAGEDRAALVAEAAQLKDQLLRALAEQENLRRRAARDKEDAAKYAISGFARDLLNVADNLRRALDSLAGKDQAADELTAKLVEGVEMTERELLNVLERHGVKRIEAKGQKFNYDLHQAMFEVQDPSQPHGTVVQELQSGYTIHDRLLRPAMVGVAKGGPNEAAQAPGPYDASGEAAGARVDTKA